MSKSLRLNLILLSVVSLLALLVWYAQPQPSNPLTAIDPGSVYRIEISDLAGRHILLQRQNGVWRTPDGPARRERIEQLLGICGTASLERFPATGGLAPYGLEPAAIRLTLNDEQLDFGTTDPIHGWRYVHYRQQIHLIADGFYHHLNADADAWKETP